MLNCIVICRCMDKKPCSNIMKDFSITSILVKGMVSGNLRGGKFMKSETTLNRPAGAFIGNKNAGSIEGSDLRTFTSILDRSSIVEKDSPETSTVIANSHGLGNSLCPSVR